MTPTLTLIAMLIAVELYHLKWIWWTQWSCRTCTATTRDCRCSDRWKWMVFF